MLHSKYREVPRLAGLVTPPISRPVSRISNSAGSHGCGAQPRAEGKPGSRQEPQGDMTREDNNAGNEETIQFSLVGDQTNVQASKPNKVQWLLLNTCF